MSYEYLDHEADIGILASGKELREAFVDGAKAMFNVMVNLDDVKPEKKVEISCNATDVAALFVEWLNELLSQRDIKDMLFSEFDVKISQKGDTYFLEGHALGQQIDQDKQEIKTEVKGATYSGLKYDIKNEMHTLQCVLDI